MNAAVPALVESTVAICGFAPVTWNVTGVPVGAVPLWKLAVRVIGLPCAASELKVAGVNASAAGGLCAV